MCQIEFQIRFRQASDAILPDLYFNATIHRRLRRNAKHAHDQNAINQNGEFCSASLTGF